jgi:hypothetical protein
MRPLLAHALAALGLAALATFALYPFCNFVFGCGCVMTGLGGAAHCNVHRPTGPHCPWCEHAWLGMSSLALILLAQGLVYVLVFRRSRSAASAGFAGVLAFPAAALLAAFLTWLPTDYPHFLGREPRRAIGLPDGPIRCVRPELVLPRAEGGAAGPALPPPP